MNGFAPPVKKLGESGIGVAAAPTGGMGLALGPDGKVPASALIGPWHEVGATGEPAFENSWVNFGGGVPTVAFCIDAAGIVWLRGIPKNGTMAATIFTLPAGYAPVSALNIGTTAGPGGVVAARLQVSSTGAVIAAEGSNAGMLLDGLSFRST